MLAGTDVAMMEVFRRGEKAVAWNELCLVKGRLGTYKPLKVQFAECF